MDRLDIDAELVPVRELKTHVPVSDMSLWRWMRDGVFPKPVKIKGRRYWLRSEVNAWLADQAARRAA